MAFERDLVPGLRKPGTWTQVNPEQIVAYRKTQKLSRASMAAMLGVSTTTIQNWETGKATATTKAQARLVETMRSGPSSVATSKDSSNGVGNVRHAGGYDSTIEAVGRIVAAFLGSMKIKREELRGVIQDVRAALK